MELAKQMTDRYLKKVGHLNNPLVLSAQAAAYAEIGDFPRAVAYASQAQQFCETLIAEGRGDAMRLLRKIELQLGEYRRGRPYRKTPGEIDATDKVIEDSSIGVR
jgi:hypothetical protein